VPGCCGPSFFQDVDEPQALALFLPSRSHDVEIHLTWRISMLKKFLSFLLVVLLTNVLVAVPALARPQNDNRNQGAEQMKIKIAKLGVGEKARATVRLKDGTTMKGYVTEARDNEFVMRDRKTNEARTVSYQDVARVEKNGGHSSARNIALGVGIGAAAVLTILAIVIVHSLD
jgi:hypothetical protein